MGRELASLLARWFALVDPPVVARLTAVADLSEPAREWFRRIPTVTQITASAEELIANPEVDVVYAAVPHQLHEQIYLQVIEAGKDLAVASKEILVMAGEIVMREARDNGVHVLPVDSEHNAIFQCLEGKRLTLNAQRSTGNSEDVEH